MMRPMMQLTNMILATLILAGQLSSAAPEEQNVLTLDQAIAMALENNRSLRNAALNVAKTQNQVAANRTYRLPGVNSYILGTRQLSHDDLRLDKGALGVLEGVGPVPVHDTAIRSSGRFSALVVNEVTQPISQLHRIGLAIDQAEIAVEMAAQQLRTEQHSVVAGVKTAYYSILQTQSSLRAAEQNIRFYREVDRLTEEYVLQRVSLKSESLEVKTRLAKAELDALSLQDVLASQKEQLNALLGRGLETDLSVKLPQETELVDMELRRAQATALEQRPEVFQAKLKVRQAEIDQRSKRSEFIPDVSLKFSQASPINESDVLPRNLTTVGIAVSWNVVDWGRKKQELAAKAASIIQADNSLKDAESLVIRDVNSNYRKLQQKARLLRIAEFAQETAAETLRVTTNSYRVNAALFKDVLQSESAMEQANDQYQQALLSLWTAKSEFEKSLGEDHD